MEYGMEFAVGDEVIKRSGDYTFQGIIRSMFTKRSGAIRLVVEDDRGLLFIFAEANLEHL